MFGWLNWKIRQKRKEQADLMRRLDRAELRAAIQSLERRRNNIETLMERMLEERRA